MHLTCTVFVCEHELFVLCAWNYCRVSCLLWVRMLYEHRTKYFYGSRPCCEACRWGFRPHQHACVLYPTEGKVVLKLVGGTFGPTLLHLRSEPRYAVRSVGVWDPEMSSTSPRFDC